MAPGKDQVSAQDVEPDPDSRIMPRFAILPLLVGVAERTPGFFRIAARFEMATHRIYVAEIVFKEWCATHQISYREMINDLRRSRVLVSDHRKVTLTGGTSLPGASGFVLEFNTEHPAMSATVTSIERLLTSDDKEGRRRTT